MTDTIERITELDLHLEFLFVHFSDDGLDEVREDVVAAALELAGLLGRIGMTEDASTMAGWAGRVLNGADPDTRPYFSIKVDADPDFTGNVLG